jgi:uncharacterized protein (DUF362 family)
MSKKSKVAVLSTKPETVLDDIYRLMQLADIKDEFDKNSTTILKDNISWHFPMPGANTTPWQLEGTILGLKKSGYNDITCVQNETVVIDAFKGEDENLYKPIFNHYNIPVLFNFKDEDIKWIKYKPESEMLIMDEIFEDIGIHIPEYFIGKNIVHLPTTKCHIYTTTTGAMKNAFGGLLNTRRHYTHTWIHETLVDLLQIQKEIHSGIFCVMDGTTAGNGPGPRTMEPVVKNTILGSSDQVAIDAVSAKLMGFDPMKIDYIRIAHEMGLGIGNPDEIEIVGDDITGQNWNFEVGQSLHRFLGWLSWYGPTKVLQRLIFRTWLVKIPIFISEFNHDYIQWPLKYQKIFKNWNESTVWGQLFSRYEKDNVIGE